MNNQIQPNYKDAQFPPLERQSEFDLRELFAAVWQGKWLVIAITALFAVGSVIFALTRPNIYTSEVLLAPAEAENSASGLAALAGQFGGLASMAGLNLDGGATDKTQLAIEVMKSRQFIGHFIEKHDILPQLMAVESWDMLTGDLVYDPEIYNPQTQEWLRDVPPPFKPKPSIQEAYKKFREIFVVANAKETGMVTVSIEHLSPAVAQQWVTWLVADINKVMRQRDVEEAMRGEAFLEEQLRQTNIADMRTVLYQLMEQAQKTIMFANVREEYVFTTVDPAIVPEERSSPNRALICVLGTLLGGMLGVMTVLIRYSFRKS